MLSEPIVEYDGSKWIAYEEALALENQIAELRQARANDVLTMARDYQIAVERIEELERELAALAA